MGDEISSGNNPQKRKWKKKKSVLSNAKKYAKKEHWGRGSKIPEDTYHYFVNILEVMKNGFDSVEDKENFVNNVLAKSINEESMLCCNQLGSRIIEELLPFATSSDLERFINIFSEDLRTLSVDKYASFVLEGLLVVCCERALDLDDKKECEEEPPSKKKKTDKSESKKEKYSKEHVENCYKFTIKVAKYLMNNMEEFIWDISANNLLRTSLKCLGGIVSCPFEKPKQNLFKNDETNAKQNNTKTTHNKNQTLVFRETPEEFKEIVKELANRISMWPQFTDMPYETPTSGLLQILITALSNSCKKLTKKLAKKLLDESFVPDSWSNQLNDDKKDVKDSDDKDAVADQSLAPPNLPPVFESDPATRLLEAVLHIARSKTYTQIYAKCFINRLAILSMMPRLNFTVQRLFDNCTEKEEFEPMFDEVAEKFDKIIVCGNTGVLVAIGKACLRLECKQVKFIQAMENAVKCQDPENQKYFAVACARLIPLNRIDVNKLNESYFVNVHGSVILQTILNFQRPKQIIDSLLSLSPKELLTLFSDAKGCHIADSYCEGKFVGVKSKELLVRRMKGTFQELAVSKHGSRALEKIFTMSSIEQKIKIMEELSDKSQILNSTMFGQLILTKLKVDLFKKSFQNWKSSLDKEEKTKNAFKEIISK